MSSPEDLRDHDSSFDSDGEHDLTSNGILEVVRNDTEHFEPRRAFDHECSSPSPPPHEGGNRFFLGSNSADGTDEAFSPVMPDISISHADDQSFDYSRSGRDSFASDVPSVLQARASTIRLLLLLTRFPPRSAISVPLVHCLASIMYVPVYDLIFNFLLTCRIRLRLSDAFLFSTALLFTHLTPSIWRYSVSSSRPVP